MMEQEQEEVRTMIRPYCGYTCQTTGIGAIYCGPHGRGSSITPAVQMREERHNDDRT